MPCTQMRLLVSNIHLMCHTDGISISDALCDSSSMLLFLFANVCFVSGVIDIEDDCRS